ncbi:MAG: DUF2914 domain-containing protein [Desulfobacteraceae bacterium]|nr:MAG: DUF2914 domain-containing protein [Desulfobacteraceae bacterium]
MLSAIVLGCSLWTAVSGHAAENSSDAERAFKLVRAVMCESIDGFEPKFVSVAFSINAGKISCYTSFEGIADTTFVEHKWYLRDELVTSKRLTLKTPRWATYSSIQLREDDKGPWRVEIWDARNQMIQTLRFSVTD